MKLYVVAVFNKVEKYADAYLVRANTKSDARDMAIYRLNDETDEKAIGYDIVSITPYNG